MTLRQLNAVCIDLKRIVMTPDDNMIVLDYKGDLEYFKRELRRQAKYLNREVITFGYSKNLGALVINVGEDE